MRSNAPARATWGGVPKCIASADCAPVPTASPTNTGPRVPGHGALPRSARSIRRGRSHSSRLVAQPRAHRPGGPPANRSAAHVVHPVQHRLCRQMDKAASPDNIVGMTDDARVPSILQH